MSPTRLVFGQRQHVLPADPEHVDLVVLAQVADDLARLGLGPVQFRDDLLLFHPAAASLEQAQDPLLVAQQFRRGPSGG